MVKCHVCKCNLLGIDLLKIHLKNVHHLSCVFGKFLCGEDNCSRTYDNWRSYRKHLVVFHKCLTNADEPQPATLCSGGSGPPDNDVDNVEIMETEPTVCDAFPCTTLDDFVSSLEKTSEILVAKLYQKSIIPRNHVQTVIDDFTDFFCGEFLEVLQGKVLSQLSLPKPSKDSVDEIRDMFNALKTPFKKFSSDFKRMSHFKSSSYYVAPETFTICENRPKTFKTATGSVVRTVKTTGQFVPLRFLLKNLFELPGALKETLDFMKTSRNSTDQCSNCTQCEVWLTKLSKFNASDIVMPVNFYYDEIEANSQLGGHSEKLGGGYAELPALPPACKSKLENILLVLLIDGDDRKSEEIGRISYNKEVFRLVVQEFNYLESEGVVCETDGGVFKIYFVLNQVNGDNLGVHGVNGFAETFTCNYPCTVCKARKEDMWCMLEEDVTLFRTKENYAEDVATDNVTLTGIKEECVFNEVKSYHVTENLSLDVMHDWAEGISHYVLIPVLKHLLDQKFFTLDRLNSRMAMFDYGPSDSDNKPTLIKDDFHSKGKLKFTASEMLCFIRLFGVFVGDLVPEADKYWQLYKVHKNITEILQSRSLPFDMKSEIDVLVKEHHELFINLTGRHLTIKFHNAVHYGTLLQKAGPLCHFSSMRGEAKHRFFRNYASSITSRRNLPKSAAIKHQLSQCYRFLVRSPLVPVIMYGPVLEFDIEEYYDYFKFKLSVPHNLKHVHSTNWVDFKGTRYEKGVVLVLGADDECGYKFGKVCDIFIVESKPLFLCNILNNSGYSDHVGGFEVTVSSKASYCCIFHQDLLDPFPLYNFQASTGERFVVLRHYL